jgi:hypothetical protein
MSRFVVGEMFWPSGSKGPRHQLHIDVVVLDSADCYRRMAGWSSEGFRLTDRRRLGDHGVFESLRNRAHGYAAILEQEYGP